MAKRVEVLLIDDCDGSDADETVQFALDGAGYEIDLNSGNSSQFREQTKRWVEHARRTGGRGAATQRSGGRKKTDPDTAKVREWARSNGFTVSERGRLPETLREAYAAAQRSEAGTSSQ